MELRRGRLGARTIPLCFWWREKNQEVLMYFLCFWWRNVLGREEKCPNSSQKPNFSVLVHSGVLGFIYSPWYAFQGMAHLQLGPVTQQGAVDVIVISANSSCCTFWFQPRTCNWRSFRTPIEAILVSLEFFGCLVFITLKKLKFQKLDQKLWSREVCYCAFHEFLNI